MKIFAEDQTTTNGRIVEATYELDTTKTPQLGLSVRIAIEEHNVTTTRRVFISSIDIIVELLNTSKITKPEYLIGKAITVYGPAPQYHGFSIKDQQYVIKDQQGKP